MRERLSKLYLDIAARLPKFEDNWIAHLQDLKERQDKEADEYLASSRRPEGNDLALMSICVYDLYFLEDFAKLEHSVFNIFANQKKIIRQIREDDLGRCKEFINRASGYFSFGSWQDLGWITSEDKMGKYASNFMVAYLRNFPKEFEHIEIQLHHVLPSLIIVSFNITFEKGINEKIESIINTRWKGKVIIASPLPWKYGCSITSSKEEKATALYNYLKGLRGKAEDFLSKYFNGYFLSNKKSSSAPVCPSVDIFSISEISEKENDLDGAIKSNREFWHSLRFNWNNKYSIFKTANLFFFSASYDSNNLSRPYRLVIVKKGLNTKMYSSIESAAYQEAFYFLIGYTNSIVFFELCNKMMSHVGELRFRVGANVMEKRFFPGRFTSLLRFNENIDKEMFVLNRVVSEYEDMRKNRMAIWKSNQVDTVQLAKSQQKLSDVFLDSIDRHLELIKKQYDTTGEAFKYYLSGLSSKVSYKLQRTVLWLTFILVVGVLVQIFLALPQEMQSKIWQKVVSILRFLWRNWVSRAVRF